MDNYAGITKRVAAYVVDQIIFLVLCLFILFISSDELFTELFNYIFSDNDTTSMSVQWEILGTLPFIALETLTITKFGWTPGKLLFGIYIKDANTLKNVTLMQAAIRSTLKELVLLPSYISDWFYILPILVLIFAILDRHKQTFYDKIVKTVVIDYKPEKHHLDLNYVGITRRVIAYIIDRSIIIGASLFCVSLVKTTFHPDKSQILIIYFYLFFFLPIVLGTFITRRLSGTLGQLLCYICIKDINTLKNPTLIQTIIRCVLFEVINFILISILIMNIFFDALDKYTSEWWFDPLSSLTFIAIILIFTSAIFDKRKQFFHDKIAKTVAIDYKPSS